MGDWTIGQQVVIVSYRRLALAEARILRLTERLWRATQGLMPFAEAAEYVSRTDSWTVGLNAVGFHHTLTAGDFRRANFEYTANQGVLAETLASEGVATTPTADGEVSKAAQPLQTTEPESDHCQTSGGEA